MSRHTTPLPSLKLFLYQECLSSLCLLKSYPSLETQAKCFFFKKCYLRIRINIFIHLSVYYYMCPFATERKVTQTRGQPPSEA